MSKDFTQNEQDLAKIAKVLSHPARVRIITTLIKKHTLSSGELTSSIPLARSSTLQHITALKDDGWLITETDGSSILYSLNTSLIHRIKDIFNPLLTDFQQYRKPHGKRVKLLFLCTGNSCRSQMAEGFINSFSEKYNVEAISAGTIPAVRVKPMAIEVMAEKGIDITKQYPKSTKEFVGDDSVDIVIFVCERAERECPYYFPFSKQKIFMPFKDPETLEEFRSVRDGIEEKLIRLMEEIPQ